MRAGGAGAADRGWGTWDPRHPGAFVHLPSGLVVRVLAYSARLGSATGFPTSPALRLGTHLAEGRFAEVELPHGDGRLRLRLAAGEGGAMAGDVEALATGEWGLRFWFLLAVGFDPWLGGEGRVRVLAPPGEAAYVEPPVAVASWDGGAAAFSTTVRPVDASPYDEVQEVAREMERRGYYSRPPGRPDGRWAVLRFNAVTPRVRFACAVAPSEDEARRRLDGALGGRPDAEVPVPSIPGEPSSRASAVRDVVGWNTVWDPENRRMSTVSTRAWVPTKFGGWAVWQIDTFLHALLAAHIGDRTTARDAVESALSLATEHGNLAALLAGTTRWVDRSHPPIGAHACWLVAERTGDRALLERAYPVLARAFDWWFRERDGNGNGLLEYGSSPVGDGHFVHTKLAAMDESSNDNSPVHDEAVFDPRTHTLDVEDVGLNSLLVHEAEMLARMADELGDHEAAAAFAARARALAASVRGRLWDPSRRVFAGRHWDGRFTASLSPTSFYPLLAGIASREQAEAMVDGWLRDPERFGGEWPVAGTPHEDPASLDNVYWRGRVWPCFNYIVYQGLRRYRFDDEATWLARRGAALFERGWAERRSFENFNQRTGEGGDSPDAEPFYTWGALLPMLADLDVVGVDPWDGLCFGSDGADEDAADLHRGAGILRAELGDGRTRLVRGRERVFDADVRGRFRGFEWSALGVRVEVPPHSEPARIGVLLPETPGEPGLDDWSVTLGDRPVAPGELGPAGEPARGVAVVAPPSAESRVLRVARRDVDALPRS